MQTTMKSGDIASGVKLSEAYRLLKLDSKCANKNGDATLPAWMSDPLQLTFDIGQFLQCASVEPCFNFFNAYDSSKMLSSKESEYSIDALDMARKLHSFTEKEVLPQVLTGVKILTWDSEGIDFFPDVVRWARI
jgi:hypothetical protein